MSVSDANDSMKFSSIVESTEYRHCGASLDMMYECARTYFVSTFEAFIKECESSDATREENRDFIALYHNHALFTAEFFVRNVCTLFNNSCFCDTEFVAL